MNSPFKTPTYSGQTNLELKDGKAIDDVVEFLLHTGWTKESESTECIVFTCELNAKATTNGI